MRSHDSREDGTPPLGRRPRHGLAWTAAALALILLATLWPLEPGGAPVPIACVWCGERALTDAILNLALFVPLGAGLVLCGVRPLTAAALGFVLTIGIEAAQIGIVPGRDASLRDVLTNGLGTALGAAVAFRASVVLFPAPGRAGWLAVAAAGVATLVLLLTGALMGFRLPQAVWYGQWAPDLGQYERFHGRVIQASLNGEPLPGHRLDDTSERIDRIRGDGALVLAAEFIPAGPTPDLAPIVSVFDEHRRKVMLLGQDRDRLRFEVRNRAEAIGLRAPAVSLYAPGWNTREASTLEALADTRGLHLTLRQGSRQWRARSSHSADVGWLFLSPFAPPTGQGVLHLLGALWVSMLWLPWGYYWTRARLRAGATPHRSATTLLALGVPMLMFAAASILHWGTPGPAAALAGGPAGALLGGLVANWTSRFEAPRSPEAVAARE